MLLDVLTDYHRIKPIVSCYDWALQNIIIPSDYQSAYKGRWNIDRFPIFKEILEEIDNPNVKEIVVLKCSQLGFSQNVLLPLALKTIYEGNPCIFATGQITQAESFLIERLKPLIYASPAFNDLQVRERDSEIYLDNGGLLTCIHQSSKGGQKTRPAKVILADELDIWANNTLEKLRSRTTHYPNAKVIVGSAPDADAKCIKIGDKFLSPIFAEYEDSSQAKYFLNLNNESFPLDFGFRKDKGALPNYGLKWDSNAKNKDGSWNESRIAETIHYQSPNGQKITDAEKDKLLDTGKWIHTFPERNRKGYYANCLYIKNKSFADIAISYLRAKRQGGLVFKTWLLENFAENLETQKIEIGDNSLRNLVGDYKRKSSNVVNEQLSLRTIMGVDVQHANNGLWWIVCDIYKDAISVKDWGHCFSFEDINRISIDYRANHVVVDAGYEVRRGEVYQASAKYKFIPVMGRPKSNFGAMFDLHTIDPQDGKKHNGKNVINQIMFQSETIKTILFEVMNNTHHTKLYLPRDYDNVLETHLTAETFENGKFLEKKQDSNHLLDCLTYCFMLARFKYLQA